MSEAELEMVCDELVGLVTEYLEGTISPVDRERFETHVRECEWCEHYVEQTRAVVAALGELGEEPPDPDALNRALIAFRDARRGSA
jgi:anti-sigma factor RsiW